MSVDERYDIIEGNNIILYCYDSLLVSFGYIAESGKQVDKAGYIDGRSTINQHHAILHHKKNQDPCSPLTVPWGRWYIPNTSSALIIPQILRPLALYCQGLYCALYYRIGGKNGKQ